MRCRPEDFTAVGRDIECLVLARAVRWHVEHGACCSTATRAWSSAEAEHAGMSPMPARPPKSPPPCWPRPTMSEAQFYEALQRGRPGPADGGVGRRRRRRLRPPGRAARMRRRRRRSAPASRPSSPMAAIPAEHLRIAQRAPAGGGNSAVHHVLERIGGRRPPKARRAPGCWPPMCTCKTAAGLASGRAPCQPGQRRRPREVGDERRRCYTERGQRLPRHRGSFPHAPALAARRPCCRPSGRRCSRAATAGPPCLSERASAGPRPTATSSTSIGCCRASAARRPRGAAAGAVPRPGGLVGQPLCAGLRHCAPSSSAGPMRCRISAAARASSTAAPRAYHSGDYEEIGWMLARLRSAARTAAARGRRVAGRQCPAALGRGSRRAGGAATACARRRHLLADRPGGRRPCHRPRPEPAASTPACSCAR